MFFKLKNMSFHLQYVTKLGGLLTAIRTRFLTIIGFVINIGRRMYKLHITNTVHVAPPMFDAQYYRERRISTTAGARWLSRKQEPTGGKRLMRFLFTASIIRIYTCLFRLSLYPFL